MVLFESGFALMAGVSALIILGALITLIIARKNFSEGYVKNIVNSLIIISILLFFDQIGKFASTLQNGSTQKIVFTTSLINSIGIGLVLVVIAITISEMANNYGFGRKNFKKEIKKKKEKRSR